MGLPIIRHVFQAPARFTHSSGYHGGYIRIEVVGFTPRCGPDTSVIENLTDAIDYILPSHVRAGALQVMNPLLQNPWHEQQKKRAAKARPKRAKV